MPDAGTEKMQRLLLMQEQLLDGKVLHKTDCADEFHVTAKTIQRDLRRCGSSLLRGKMAARSSMTHRPAATA